MLDGGERVLDEGERVFASWDEYSVAWDAFEELVQLDRPLSYNDIPWPNLASGSVTGATRGMSEVELKKRSNLALQRWHPSRWQTLLQKIVKQDLDTVWSRILKITEAIIHERRVRQSSPQ